MKKQIRLIVLAGGFGTRLQSVLSNVPKPLAPVGEWPFLHYLIENWVRQGVTELTFLLHHKAHLIKRFLEKHESEGRLKGCEVQTLTEPEPLGTGGAIAYAVRQQKITGSFLVTNADTWLGTGLHTINDAVAPAMAVVSVANAERYGNVEIANHLVSKFNEKQILSGQGWINAGLYHLHADLFANLDGNAFSLERQIFPKLVEQRELKAISLKTEFIDIGIPDDYFRFCRWIKSNKKENL